MIWPGLELLADASLRSLPLGPAFNILASLGYAVQHDFSEAAPESLEIAFNIIALLVTSGHGT